MTSNITRACATIAAGFIGIASASQELAIWNNVSDGFRTQAKVRTGAGSPTPSAIGPYDARAEGSRAIVERVGSELDSLMGQLKTRIVLISSDRQLIYENYASRWMRRSTPLGYSMSKSLTAMTVGHAICANPAWSLDTKLEQVVPRLRGTSWGSSTVEDLLRMKSGSSRQEPERSGWQSEEVAAFHRAVFLGAHGSDVIDSMIAHDLKAITPGVSYQYSNYDTLALGFFVEAISGKKFYDYFFESVWPSIGAAQPGAWLVNDLDQTFSSFGFSASPEDWLRIGHHVIEHLRRGDCLGQFLSRAVLPLERTYIPTRCYGFQIWNWCSRDAFFFFGFGGQFLIMHPARNWVAYAHQTSHVNDARLIKVLRDVMY
jgi:hypothetical protein